MKKSLCFLTMLVFGCFIPKLSIATACRIRIQRQYPIPNAFEVPPITNIGITVTSKYDATGITEGDTIMVTGSHSGVHDVEMHLSDDGETLIIHPIQPFEYHETIRVILHAEMEGHSFLDDSFQFRTMVCLLDYHPMLKRMERYLFPASDTDSTTQDTLPPMRITVDNSPDAGTIYFTNFTIAGPKNNTFLFELDEHGNILKKQDLGHVVGLDFKEQPKGMLTYFNSALWKYYGLDSNWNVIDSFTSVNGYPVDMHELRVLPDGSYALQAISYTTLDSSQWVPGMVRGASISGDVIQIFDAHGNETFEWRGIDHYRVADAIHENLADSGIDFEHANSIDFDSTGNILFSNRHLCEISQIDRQTGNFIWRLGGAHNQFQLLGDSIWFSYQHAARWLPNGHLVLFDNSNYDSVYNEPHDSNVYINHSRALEYALDTSAKTATLVWQFQHIPETFTIAMGNVDRLPNGNTFIGWGLNNQVSLTEVTPDHSTIFEMCMDSGNVSYRAFKYLSDPLSLVPLVQHDVPITLTLNGLGTNITALYTLPHGGMVTMRVFDILGRDLKEPISNFEVLGSHAVPVPTQGLPSGTYFCELQLEGGAIAMAPFAISN